MTTTRQKAKHLLILLVKIGIVSAAFYFIYRQLAHNDQLDWEKFTALFKKNQSVGGILFLLGRIGRHMH